MGCLYSSFTIITLRDFAMGQMAVANRNRLSCVYLEKDDDSAITHSSYGLSRSSWSTNMTMSNLPGPGRLLGKLYSRAGRLLEYTILNIAHLRNQRGMSSEVESAEKEILEPLANGGLRWTILVSGGELNSMCWRHLECAK